MCRNNLANVVKFPRAEFAKERMQAREDVGEERINIARHPACRKGCRRLNREARHGCVDADADDGAAICHLHEDSANFLSVNEHIVGPFDLDRLAGQLFCNRAAHSRSCHEWEPRGTITQAYDVSHEHRNREAIPRGRAPGAIKSSAPSTLIVGHDDTEIWPTRRIREPCLQHT